MARKTTKRKKVTPDESPERPARRSALGRIGIYAVGGIVLAGGAGAFAMDFRKKLNEQDLSAIGQGTPVIVQIHDPQCSLCTSLQKNTRKALRAFDEDGVVYRVANIKTEAGAAFQARAGLPHVSLVLFDGAGERVHVVQGVTPVAELIDTFRRRLRVPLS